MTQFSKVFCHCHLHRLKKKKKAPKDNFYQTGNDAHFAFIIAGTDMTENYALIFHFGGMLRPVCLSLDNYGKGRRQSKPCHLGGNLSLAVSRTNVVTSSNVSWRSLSNSTLRSPGALPGEARAVMWALPAQSSGEQSHFKGNEVHCQRQLRVE